MKKIFVLFLCILTISQFSLSVFALDDGSNYFKFIEIENLGDVIVVEGTDKIFCYESFYDQTAGFFDEDGNKISHPSWRRIAGFFNGIARVSDENGKAIFIDTKGDVILSTKYNYDYTGNYSEGLISVLLVDHNSEGFGGKRGYINIQGDVVLKVASRFDKAGDFINGYAPVSKIYDGVLPDFPKESGLGMYIRGSRVEGYINKQGEFVGEPNDVSVYDYYHNFNFHDLSIQNTDPNGAGSWYLADERTGERISKTNFNQLCRVAMDLYAYKLEANGKWGLISSDGRIISEPKYSIPSGTSTDYYKLSDASPLSHMAFMYGKNDKELICIDATGKELFKDSLHLRSYRTNHFILVMKFTYLDNGQVDGEKTKHYLLEVNDSFGTNIN